jgi:hypothetical protein
MAKFYQTIKEELTPIPLKLFQEIKREGTLPNSVYETRVTLILKSNKDTTRKQNYRPISLTNIDAKFSTKYWQTEFNNTSKRSYATTRSVSLIQGWFNIHKSINIIQHIHQHRTKTTQSSQ